jgi:molecular chaperone Hsp33
MPDRLASASAPTAGIAVAAAVTTELVREIRDRHDLSPVTTAAVGRLATGAVLLAAGLKGRERITLQVVAEGPVGGIAADAWLLDDVTIGARGYARNPHVDLPLNSKGKFDVAAALGAGSLHVTKTYEVGRPYRGVVPLSSGEIAEDLAVYLARSEQIPSAIALGVLANPEGVMASGGVLAQTLPGADDKEVAGLERRAEAMAPVTRLVSEGADAGSLIEAIAGDLPLREHRAMNVRFACLCSREKVEQALIGLGSEDLRRMAQERDRTEASCEFCKKRYYFSSEELLTLSSKIG